MFGPSESSGVPITSLTAAMSLSDMSSRRDSRAGGNLRQHQAANCVLKSIRFALSKCEEDENIVIDLETIDVVPWKDTHDDRGFSVPPVVW